MPDVPDLELAHAYDPGPDVVVPDLVRLPGAARSDYPLTVEETTTHVDTAGLALTRAGVRLSCRATGDDPEWLLQLPGGHPADGLHVPVSPVPGEVPARLRQMVQAWVRGDDLVPVASVTTARTSRAVFDEHETIIAELVDEVSTATRDGDSKSWRRWELRADDAALLDAADALLLESGIARRDRSGDRAEALADLLGVRRPTLDEELGRSKPAGRVLRARVREQLDALRQADAETRLGLPSGVHHVRLACRRLRSALSTFGPLLTDEVREPLREELRWLAGSLGSARDQHVVRERLVALVEGEDEVAGPVLERVLAADWADHDDGQVGDILDSERYFELLHALDALVDDPAWTPAAEEDAGPFLRRRLGKDWDRLARRVEPVAGLEPGSAPDEALHDIRKAAKRLRYALEAAELVWRRKPRRLRAHVRGLTRVLGERQDTVVTREALLGLAAQADAAGEPTFTHGRLDHIEERRAAALEEQFQRNWSVAVRKRADWP